MAEVPIYSRGVVVAHALVDDEDLGLVSRYRWHLVKGYAAAGIVHPEGGWLILSSGKRKRRQTKIKMHRLILGLNPGEGEPDHINRNKLDNRRENLRLGSHIQNTQNHPGHVRTSRQRGVYWDPPGRDRRVNGRWRVEFSHYGQRHNLGSFRTEEEAVEVAQGWLEAHA